MKTTLSALVTVLALSVGCATNNSTVQVQVPAAAAVERDGKYDSIDDLVDREDVEKLKDASYMVISESKYKNSKGETVTFHSLGTAVLYGDVGPRTYLVTVNHVVQNDEVIYSLFRGKFEKVSEQFYLLEDYEVDVLHRAIRKPRKDETEIFYAEDSSGDIRTLNHFFVRTSNEIEVILNSLKPKKITTAAYNEEQDLAIISVPKLQHQPLTYSVGNAKELQTQNMVYVTGWPGGLVKNVTRGHITSVNDSKLVHKEVEAKGRFIFDASISPGNSGGGIFAVRDGKFELVGLTSAMYLNGNDLYIGVKINGISDVFKGNSIRCVQGWKCNLSSPHELKL